MGVPRSGLWDLLLDPQGVRDMVRWIGHGRDLAKEAPSVPWLGPVPALDREAFLKAIWRGGFPALLDMDDEGIAQWRDGFERAFLERDAFGLGGVSDVVPFRRVVRMASLQAGGILNVSEMARAVALSAPTVHRYLDILEVTMMGFRIAPILSNRRKRLIRTPKFYLVDSGLHAHLCGIRSADALAASPLLGAVVETFVLQQVRAALAAACPHAEVGYWRTADGYEVDFVIERDDRALGIEVQSGTAPGVRDLRGLSVLREEAGDRFVAGVVLHGGTRVEVLGDRLIALPAVYAGM